MVSYKDFLVLEKFANNSIFDKWNDSYGHLNFVNDKALFDDENLSKFLEGVKILKNILSKYPNIKFDIHAHTSSPETKAYDGGNQELSEKRALYVENLLKKNGVDEKHINKSIGYGANYLICVNDKGSENEGKSCKLGDIVEFKPQYEKYRSLKSNVDKQNVNRRVEIVIVDGGGDGDINRTKKTIKPKYPPLNSLDFTTIWFVRMSVVTDNKELPLINKNKQYRNFYNPSTKTITDLDRFIKEVVEDEKYWNMGEGVSNILNAILMLGSFNKYASADIKTIKDKSVANVGSDEYQIISYRLIPPSMLRDLYMNGYYRPSVDIPFRPVRSTSNILSLR